MPRKTLPANIHLDVPLLRAITAIRVQLDNELQDNPGLPNFIVELDDALEAAEDHWNETKHPDFIRIRVKYHESDFIL